MCTTRTSQEMHEHNQFVCGMFDKNSRFSTDVVSTMLSWEAVAGESIYDTGMKSSYLEFKWRFGRRIIYSTHYTL